MSSSVVQVVNSVYALQNQSNLQDQMLFKTKGKDTPFDGGTDDYIYLEGYLPEPNGTTIIRHKNNGGSFVSLNGVTKNNLSELVANSASSLQVAAYTAQALAARDAAIIQAGVYATEPEGRAAVADGTAFKVQGSGDVAAYEYRRVNSGSSTLIATYPSISLISNALKNRFVFSGSGTVIPLVIFLDGKIASWYDTTKGVIVNNVDQNDTYLQAVVTASIKNTSLSKTAAYAGVGAIIPIVQGLDGKVLIGWDTVNDRQVGVTEQATAAAATLLKMSSLGKQGTFTGSGTVIPLVISLDGKILSGWDTATDQPTGSSSVVIESQPVPLASNEIPARTDWNMVMWNGESTTVGAYTSALINSAQPYNNLTFLGGPSSSKSGSVGLNPRTGSVIPLVETGYRAETSGSLGAIETPVSATLNYTVERSIIEDGITSASLILFGAAAGHSGYRLDQLVWGQTWAQLAIDQVSEFSALAATATKTKSVTAIILDVTVNDAGALTSAASYEASLRAFIQGAQTNLKTLTGQTTPIHVFVVQASAYLTTSAGADIAKAIQKVCKDEPFAHLLPPVYHMPFYDDLIHMTQVGYAWKGKIAGKHLKQLLSGYKPQPLNPVSATFKNNVLTCKFSIRYKPLVLDVTNITALTNYGIRAKDDAGDLILSNLKIINGDTLQWTTNRALTTNPVLRFGLDYGITGGAYLGAATNIRDSYTDTAIIDGTARPLFDVCPAAELPIIQLGL